MIIIIAISYIVMSVIVLAFMRGSCINNEEDIKDSIK